MATQILDKNVLLSDKVWVLFKYDDGSEFCFQTTMSPSILSQEGIILEQGKLPRLDKKYYEGGTFVYRQFPFEDVVVSLWDSEHYTDAASEKLKSFM